MLYDVFLFPELQIVWKGWGFNDTTMMQANSKDTLAKFQTMHLQHVCWTHCMKSQENYFEGDNIV
jgi:hypothetical protein